MLLNVLLNVLQTDFLLYSACDVCSPGPSTKCEHLFTCQVLLCKYLGEPFTVPVLSMTQRFAGVLLQPHSCTYVVLFEVWSW